MPKAPKTLTESFNEVNEDSATQFMRADARRMGLEWHVYCTRFGIVGDAAKRRIRRHEDHKRVRDVNDMSDTG